MCALQERSIASCWEALTRQYSVHASYAFCSGLVPGSDALLALTHSFSASECMTLGPSQSASYIVLIRPVLSPPRHSRPVGLLIGRSCIQVSVAVLVNVRVSVQSAQKQRGSVVNVLHGGSTV